MITIHPSERIDDGDRTRLVAQIDFAGTARPLWYSVPQAYAEFLTPGRQDAFVVALLPAAMQLGQDIRVEGVMSERLFYNLSRHVGRILTVMYPWLRPVKILPTQLCRTVLPGAGAGVATGLSGGVDSFAVLADHFFGPVSDGYKITHGLFHNVGSHGHDEKARALFRERHQRLVPLASELGLPLVTIDSNLHELLHSLKLDPSPQFVLTHSLRNASAALVLQKLLRKYLYASAFPYQSCRIRQSDAMGYSDPYLIHLLSTETMECISTGCQFNRVEKTRRVAELPLSYRFLDVCCRKVTSGNCGVCKKCARTLLTLEVLGKLPAYAGVFDLERYQHIRRRQMAHVLISDDPFCREIRSLAKSSGFEFPREVRWAAWLRWSKVFPGKRSLKGH